MATEPQASDLALQAGAAERIITPPVGTPLVGWTVRAAGDLCSRYVHDDLYVKVLILQRGASAWALVVCDLIGVDAVTTQQIRDGICQCLPLKPAAILVCATHTHSGPAVCPIAAAVPPETLGSVRSDRLVSSQSDQAPDVSRGVALHQDDVDEDWRQRFVGQAVEAARAAWVQLAEAEVGSGWASVSGVASSRRVRLSDGSWADPRREWPVGAEVLGRSEIDPLVRVLLVRNRSTQVLLAAVINYGTHPWVFSTAGISAELAGACCQHLAQAWQVSGAVAPIVLHMTGPLGDATLIWNVNVVEVWKNRPGESLEASLARRERAFDHEVARLGRRLADGALAAAATIERWNAAPALATHRTELLLPLKASYRPEACIRLAPWQLATAGQHRTEIQVLRVGGAAILGLPGEPFVALGGLIRAQAPFATVFIAAPSNDYGAVSYLAEQADYAQGGYELTVTPAGPGAGERLVEQAVQALRAVA